MTSDPELSALGQLVGTWTTEATHPAMPGVVVHGTVLVEWLEGERFLIQRMRTDHPKFPDSISIIGHTGRDRVDGATGGAPAASDSPLQLHYFDSRGVSRVYHTSVDDTTWRIWRDAPGFSQRFTGTITDGGRRIAGRWQLCEDDRHWTDDVEISYQRTASADHR